MENFGIAKDPFDRERHIEKYLKEKGLSHIKEDEKAAYCALSLTGVDKETLMGPNKISLYDIVGTRQRQIKNILALAGITGYDPREAPYSPDNNPSAQREEICEVDTGKIAGAEYFTMLSIAGSSGGGVEMQKAEKLIRMAVILTDHNITDTRMKAAQTINIGYEHLERQADRLKQVFEMLKQYTPGTGLKCTEGGVRPILIGFPKKSGGKPIDLEDAVHTTFPELKYTHRSDIPPIKLIPADPNQFYEIREATQQS